MDAEARQVLEAMQREIEALQRQLAFFERDRWAGGTVYRGELPQMPTVAALPAAGADFAFKIVVIPGDGATTADVSYQCLRNSAGAWGWRTVATG